MSSTLASAIHSATGQDQFQQSDVSSLHGKTAVVTGGTAGIGFEVAKTLALAGARVILLSRKMERGDEAITELKKLAQEEGIKINAEFNECDLGSLQNVKEVADQICQVEERLDLLICDAGVGVTNYAESSDGIDRHFAVNVLGHILLINRLLPLIRKTSRLPNVSPPRIVSLSSSLHQMASSSIKFESLDEINDCSLSPPALYARTKLAIILYTRFGLVEKVIGPSRDKIYAMSVHPGAVDTEIQDQYKQAYGPLFGTLIKYAQKPFMCTPEEGSLSTLWAATSPDVVEKNLQGVYFQDVAQWGGETKQAQDKQLGENVWKLCHDIIAQKLGRDALLSWDEASG